MMIKREVFEKLSHVPEYRSSTLKDPAGNYIKPVAKQFLTRVLIAQELYFRKIIIFVELWGKHGGKVYVDPNIHLKHIGTHVFGKQTLRIYEMNTNPLDDMPIETLVLLLLNVGRLINDTKDPEVLAGLKIVFNDIVYRISPPHSKDTH